LTVRKRKRLALVLVLLGPFTASARNEAFHWDFPEGTSSLEVRDGGTTLVWRISPPLSHRLEVRALDHLLTMAFPEKTLPKDPVSLDVGPIRDHTWLMHRLASAALQSPHWDAEHGKPRAGKNDAAVALIVEDGQLVNIYATDLALHGAKIQSVSVEKVLVGEVGKTPELAPLASDPAAVGKRVPYDAILTLRLEKSS